MSNTENDITNLKGQLLLATPFMPDEDLRQTMVYICTHGAYGAMGIIVNKLIPTAISTNIIKQSLPDKTISTAVVPLYLGGLEDIDTCFILHIADPVSISSMLIDNNIALTTTNDLSTAIAEYATCKHKIICIGCHRWDNDQLEEDIQAGYWIPLEATHEILFQSHSADKWKQALIHMGSQEAVFSTYTGSA